MARSEIRNGRFQRVMAVMTIFAAVMTGFESYTQHLRGAFSNWLMWTPVWLTVPVVGTSLGALFSERIARKALPVVSTIAVVAGVAGFLLHLRGIRRMPGGFKLGQYNLVMGPPVFAPLLACAIGVFGLLAGFMRRGRLVPPLSATTWAGRASNTMKLVGRLMPRREDERFAVAHGEYQKQMALAAAFFAFLTGAEVYFEHLRGSFNQRTMWIPVWVTLPMVTVSMAAWGSRWAAKYLLLPVSWITFLVGLLGGLLHFRGARDMPGGFRSIRFAITLGPPLFAPMLFSAVGLMGIIAALARRRD